MSYRSDVKVLVEIKEKSLDEIKDEIMKCGEIFNKISTNKNQHLVLCEAGDIKWYESFEEIQAFEKWMRDIGDLFDADKLHGGIHFVRIGEDIEDNEERYYGDVNYWLDLVRDIDVGRFQYEN